MSFNRPVTQLISQRFSCRSYLDRPIEEQERQLLASFASSSRVGPFGALARFELVTATEEDTKALRGLGTYGLIRGATGFMIGAMEDGEKNLEDFGYLMERIVLYATDLGLGTCWLGGTFNKSRFARRISASGRESVPAVVSVGHISEKRGRLDSVIRKGAGSETRLPWDRMFFDGEFGAPISRETAGSYAEPLEMVRLGPSASNRQPWRIIKDGRTWHFYLQRTPGYRDGRLMRLWRIADMQRLDMGIAMSHFELTADELGLQGNWEVREPAIARPDELTEYTVSRAGA